MINPPLRLLSTTLLYAVLGGSLGCSPVHEVGSACPGGECTQAAITGVPCLTTGLSARLDFGQDGTACLPWQPSVSAGGSNCELILRAETSGPSWCSDLGLQRYEGHLSEEGYRACVLPQATLRDGALVEPDGLGWYYDDSSAEARLECGETGVRVGLTTAALALPATGALPLISCDLAITSTAEAAPALELDEAVLDVSASSCLGATSKSAAGVGDSCLPAVEPPQGYSPREAYIQTGASECETGTCMAYQIGGALSTPGPSGIYCTCRCDAPEGSGCECPNGFACVTVFQDVAPHLDGGYCVRLPNGGNGPGRVEVGPASDAGAP